MVRHSIIIVNGLMYLLVIFMLLV